MIDLKLTWILDQKLAKNPDNFSIFALEFVDILPNFSERNLKSEQSYHVLSILTLFVL